MASVDSEEGEVTGFWEYGNELPGSTKGGTFLKKKIRRAVALITYTATTDHIEASESASQTVYYGT